MINRQNAAKWCSQFTSWRTSTNNSARNGRPTTASTPDKKMCVKCSSQKYKNNDQWNITKLESLPWNSFQDHLGVWAPQGMYMMGAVSTIRKAQNKRDDFVSSHSCNNMLLVATDFSSALSLEMRHKFITITDRWNVPAWSVNTLGPWKWRSWHQAPCDNHLFPVLKSHFGGYKFTSDDDMKTAVIWWLQLHDTQFHKQEIKKLVFFYNRCIILGRDTVNSKVAVINLHVYCFY
jgi:hypothetical protein